MTDDELDKLLTPTSEPTTDSRKEPIFARTLALHRRVRLRRRASAILGVASVFVVGIAVGWFGKPTPPPVIVREIEKVFVPVEPPASTENFVWTPERLELEAEKATDPANCANYYRQAGDLFLRARQVEAAMRCYRQHLNEGGVQVAAVQSDDSWLLTSLKQSSKENLHANANPE